MFSRVKTSLTSPVTVRKWTAAMVYPARAGCETSSHGLRKFLRFDRKPKRITHQGSLLRAGGFLTTLTVVPTGGRHMRYIAMTMMLCAALAQLMPAQESTARLLGTVKD